MALLRTTDVVQQDVRQHSRLKAGRNGVRCHFIRPHPSSSSEAYGLLVNAAYIEGQGGGSVVMGAFSRSSTQHAQRWKATTGAPHRTEEQTGC